MEDDTFKRILQDKQFHLQIKAEQKEIIQNVSERKDSMAECYQRAWERACVTSLLFGQGITGTCFIQKIYAPSSSLHQGKHLPFTPSPLRLNIFRLFVILSLTQSYRYTPEIFLFSTATFKYKYRAPLRRIEQEYSAKVAFSIFQSLKRIQSLPVRYKLI